jgi:hypothetical protein
MFQTWSKQLENQGIWALYGGFPLFSSENTFFSEILVTFPVQLISRLLYSQADLELLIFWTKRGVLHTTENNTHFVMKTWSIYNRAYRKK